MRDIIFRGKRKDIGEWEYGNLICSKNYAIGSQDFPLQRPVVVAPDTVGQYTGLTDKNGERIFEGDIVKTNFFGKDDGKGHNFADYDKFVVKWNDCGFVITNQLREFGFYKSDTSIEVIGNIHDNPELINA